MVIVHTSSDLISAVRTHRVANGTIGLVPTMGALHDGHRSLVDRAVRECGSAVVTIFVNPAQFDDVDDFVHYPHTLDADLAMCRDAGVDIVFAPSTHEIFPEWPCPPETTVSVGRLGRHLEGVSRPGHFDGVATIVARLFAMVGPCRSYFGEKDFQQLAIVRRLVADLSFPVDVVGCPTVREPDGLAMSSRNARLSPPEREAATALWRSLQAGSALIGHGERRHQAVVAAMTEIFDADPLAVLDYAAVVDDADLTVPSLLEIGRDVRIVVAATIGSTRLIDNCRASCDVIGPEGPRSDDPARGREVALCVEG